MNIDTQPKHREMSQKYWGGFQNKCIRYYYYVQRGLNSFNEFKYIIATIIAIYYMCKLDNPILIPVFFFICIPILGWIGHYHIHKMAKRMEYYNMLFSSHWGRIQFDLTEERNELLKQVLAELQKRNVN